MANQDRREALRGAEEETFDLLAQVLTSKQWEELLKAPLERAAAKGNRGLVQKLLEAGAEIGDAVHAAVRGGHEEVVSDLLGKGASVAAKSTNQDGYSPLHVAAREGKAEMVWLLLHKGADKDALTSSYNQYTPLYLAAEGGHMAAVLALLAAGADVSIRSFDYQSVLYVAAYSSGHVDIMRALIQRGAEVDAANNMDQATPLHAAVESNNTEAIDLLVETGANIEARQVRGHTPLHYAAFYLYPQVLSALLKHGAHVNAENEDQDTPLHCAAAKGGERGASEVVDSLLRAGADETILNHEGKAAADMVRDGEPFSQSRFVVPEDVDRVRELLENAPADRVWRRRGYLVLCRAHPDRMKLIRESHRTHTGMVPTTRGADQKGKTEVGDCKGAVEACPVDEVGGCDWAVVVARVLGLREEGIFRTVVEYL